MRWVFPPYRAAGVMVAIALTVGAVSAARYLPRDRQSTERPARGAVMLVLRGVASASAPRGQLDDDSALKYAQRLGYVGEVLDVAGTTGSNSPQVRMALDRIHHDRKIAAIYGFSGGGYNAKHIWEQLKPAERERIAKIVVVGSPGVDKGDFPGSADVVIRRDPSQGHMAGPRVLLEELNRTVGGRS